MRVLVVKCQEETSYRIHFRECPIERSWAGKSQGSDVRTGVVVKELNIQGLTRHVHRSIRPPSLI